MTHDAQFDVDAGQQALRPDLDPAFFLGIVQARKQKQNSEEAHKNVAKRPRQFDAGFEFEGQAQAISLMRE